MRGTNDNQLIYGKTARQVDELSKNGKLYLKGQQLLPARLNKKTRFFTALQFEASADCEGNNLLDLAFYTHRLYGFLLYRLLKLFGVQKANIGAYGFGVTDAEPIVLKSIK
jgi:hypothetical protein